MSNAQAEESASAIVRVFSSLSASIRETDFWGWYEENAVGGIVFTEFNGRSKSAILATISRKLETALHSTLSLERLKQLRLSFHFFPEDWNTNEAPPDSDNLLFPEFRDQDGSQPFSRSVKRCVDIAGSLLGVILLSPVLAAVAIAIKLDSKGPVLFRQQRVGQHGQCFGCFKFRSMAVESDPHVHEEYVRHFISGHAGTEQLDVKGNAVYKLAQDNRVTRLGRFLRRASLDELPQLLNVLRGEMSLVGPRPPVPYELHSYHVWHMRRIFEAKPGITGLWQVKGRSRTTFDEMVRLDLRYAKTQSLWLDLKILLQTPRAVISGQGAY